MKPIFKSQSAVILLLNMGLILGLSGQNNSGSMAVAQDLSSISNPAKKNIETKAKATPGPSTAEEIAAAKSSGKLAFIIVYEPNVPALAELEKTVATAKLKVPNSVVIKLDRSNAENEALNTRYQLAGAPLPLVLVISPKGYVVGGLLAQQATPEALAALIPSPKLEEINGYIIAKKPVFVVFSKKSFSDRTEVVNICKDAVKMLKDSGAVVEVDMDDNKEESLMNNLRINKSAISSTTIVVNTQGQVAGTSITSIPDAAKLASAATAPVKAGCGPGCGPAGCSK
ncbi:MAG: hypothetical protein NTV01_01670 [Bacteroidia bacterium]|nr:hypothetical protein [Bacteroidia bacterium]